MDSGFLIFAFFAAFPLYLLIYALYRTLTQEWRKVRAREQAFDTAALENKAERLVKRAEAHERTLEDTVQKLEQRAADLDRASGEYARRLENLEAVVVAQVWSPLDPSAPAQEEGPPRFAGTRPHEASGTSAGGSPRSRRATKALNRRRTARLAHRLEK